MVAANRAGSWLALVLVTAVGVWARTVPWGMTFTAEGVRFRTDTDPYYHALRARQTLADWPRPPWADAAMNFPYGGEIPWPPLFDLAISSAAKLLGLPAADTEGIARAASLLALVIGAAVLPLVAVLGRRLLGGGLWLDAALLVAVLPASTRFGAVGAADQHGAELLIFCGILLAFVSSFRGTEGHGPSARAAPLLLGVLTAAAFWNWPGSALYLLALIVVAGSWRVAAPPADTAARAMARALAIGGAAAAGALAATIVLFAPGGSVSRGALNGLSGLHPAMCGSAGLFGALLLAAERLSVSRSRAGRIVVVGGAAIGALLPFAAIPPLRAGVARGLAALTRGNPWYATVGEYRPLLLSGGRPLSADIASVLNFFGLSLFLMPLAGVVLWLRWRDRVEERPATFFLFVWGALFLALTLFEQRFQLYLVVPMALWLCLAFRTVAARLRAPALAVSLGGIALAAAPSLVNAVSGGYALQQAGFESDLIPALRWLRRVSPSDSGRPAVMGEWEIGHVVRYFADKPVVATPFGTEAASPNDPPSGPGPMQDWAAFLFARDDAAAEAVLSRRRAGFVVLESPKSEVSNAFAFAPPGTPPAAHLEIDGFRGARITGTDAFWKLVPTRLYYFDGMPADGVGPALEHFRLLYESAHEERVPGVPPASLFKVFGVVPGARIRFRGAAPGAVLTAECRVETNRGRVFAWRTRIRTDSTGAADLGLPYATGENGAVRASSYRIADGVHGGTLALDEKDVAGAETVVDLTR